MRKRMPLLAAAILASIAVSSSGYAESATAEALFQEGKALMKQSKFDQACPKLEESYRQDPATGALLALAMCHEKQGKLASAWAEYIDAASRSKQEGRKDRADAARKSADSLKPRLSQLTLEVSNEANQISGLEIRRDGVAVGRGAWGTSTPIDAGQHTIEVSAPGYEPWSTTVDIGGNADRRTVAVPGLKAADKPTTVAEPNAPVSQSSATPRPTAPPPTSQNSAGLKPLQIAGLVAGGLGVVTLGVGTYFGLTALSGKSDTDSACPASGCTNSGSFDKRQDAYKAGNTATIAFIAGGALVAAGATLYIVGGTTHAESGVTASVTPVIGPRDTSLVVTGAF